MPDPITDVTPQTAEGAGTQVTGMTTGAAPQADTTAGERQFTQTEVNAMVRKAEEAVKAKAKAKADEDAAINAGKFQELADQRQARISEIEPQLTTLQERVTAYENELSSQVKERIKTLPASLQKLLPEGDALARYKALLNLEAAAQELRIAASPGTPPGPNGSGAVTTPRTTIDEIAAKKRASGGYG